MREKSRKRRICVVINNRANYGRIKSALRAIHAHPDLELQLIVGSSALLDRFGEAVQLIEKDGFPINARFYSIIEGENPTTMAKSTGLIIMELATLFDQLKPDIVLTIADRFETMATAVATSYMNIPLAHTQGGEITGSIDESVRHAVSKLAHIHFPATRLAADYLVRMGERPDTVHWVGCPSIDVVAEIDLAMPPGMIERYGGVGAPIDMSKPYLVVLQHPVTTEFGRGLDQIRQTLEAVSRIGMQAVWLWPNVDAGSDDISRGLRIHRERNPQSPIRFFKNFGVEDYARLMNNAAVQVGNSSSALREGAFLGVPAVNIGTRQQGREHGENVITVGYDAKAIEDAIRKQLAHGRYPRSTLFGNGDAGKKLTDILATAEIGIQKQLAYGSAG
ncbi:MAG TPA: UDP-N-acetylglucosamine 2-epimerase [Pseudolabrys sp.]|nr:UDP-N-acetylglucosamine 2-epimerase [Pseudolabrys sp.]